MSIVDAIKEWKEQLEQWDFSQKSGPGSIKPTLMMKYAERAKKELLDILTLDASERDICNKLEDYLLFNWERIKSGPLAYTATPDSEITVILCGIATAVSDYKNTHLVKNRLPCTPIQLLMPGISYDSLHPAYHDLGPIAEQLCLNPDEETELVRIYRILKMEGHQAQSNQARKDELEEKQQGYFNQLALVQSGVLKPLTSGYLVLNQTLHHIVKTHIMGYKSLSIIPISVLLEDDVSIRPYENEKFDKLQSEFMMLTSETSDIAQLQRQLQYQNMSDDERENLTEKLSKLLQTAKQLEASLQIIKKDEYNRLINHSIRTQAIQDTQVNFKRLDDAQKNNFYDHLTALLVKLRENDAYAGTGSVLDAGARSYEAIRHFSVYYRTLGYQLKLLAKPEEAGALLPYEVGILIHLPIKSVEGTITGIVKNDDGSTFHIAIAVEQLPFFSNYIRRSQNKSTVQNIDVLFEEIRDDENNIIQILFEQYPLLKTKEKKVAIPNELKAAIETLLSLSSNKQLNVSATENIETCMARRRVSIEKTLTVDMRPLLQRIDCTDERYTEQKNAALIILESAKDSLRLYIKNPLGQASIDKLPLSKALLDKFEISINLKEEIDVDVFKELLELDSQELISILQDESIKGGLRVNITNIHQFVGIVYELTIPQLEMCLEMIGSFIDRSIHCSFLNSVVPVFEGEKRDILIDYYIKYILQDDYGFIYRIRENMDDPDLIKNFFNRMPSNKLLQIFLNGPSYNKYNNPTWFEHLIWEVSRDYHLGKVRPESDLVRYAPLESVKIIADAFIAAIDALPESSRYSQVFDKHMGIIQCAATYEYYPELFEKMLEVLPEFDRLIVLKKSVLDAEASIFGLLLNLPKLFEKRLNYVPEIDRLTLLTEQMSPIQTSVFHHSIMYPDTFKIIFSLIPESQRLTALNTVDSFGQSVLDCLLKGVLPYKDNMDNLVESKLDPIDRNLVLMTIKELLPKEHHSILNESWPTPPASTGGFFGKKEVEQQNNLPSAVDEGLMLKTRQ